MCFLGLAELALVVASGSLTVEQLVKRVTENTCETRAVRVKRAKAINDPFKLKIRSSSVPRFFLFPERRRSGLHGTTVCKAADDRRLVRLSP